jgi:ectoine hydroxylase-related dioxygenase (phytanoyl-CoA dioxygenase family)
MLNQTQIALFHRQGFLNGGPVLNQEEVAELRDSLEAIMAKGPEGFGPGETKPVLFRDISGGAVDGRPGPNPVWQIVNIWEASPAFERLIYHPAITRGISQLTGHEDLQVWHDQIQYKPANHGGTTRWHQDAPLWPIIRPMTPVSAWIPFDDADEENGCMWMVPGSHTWGNQMEYLRTRHQLTQREEFGQLEGFSPPAGAQINAVEAHAWPIKKGEVSFHHSLAWHGSPANHSPRPRRAIAIHYMTGEACYDAKGEHPMKQFVTLPDGAPMAEAGPHFPKVFQGGQPVEVPARLRN